MKSRKQIEQLVSRIRKTPSTQMDQQIQNGICRAIKKQQKTIPAAMQPNSWSKIMKSPAAKGAIAAILIMGVFIGIKLLDGAPAYGMSEVVEQLRNARTIHIYNFLHLKTTPSIEHEDTYVLEDWIDIENGRTRTSGLGHYTTVDPKSGTFKNMVSKIEHVFDGKYQMQITHRFKTVQFYKLSNYQKILHTRKSLEKFLSEIQMNSNELWGYTKIGQERIDNELLDVWERERFTADGNFVFKTVCWVKPSMYEIRYLKEWIKENDNDEAEWRLSYDRQIELNVTPPPTTFLTEPPEGYSHANTKETAIEYPLNSCQLPLKTIESIIVAAFTLPDDSVIMGWYSEDKNNANPDDHIFENLEMGGGIPKLPAEVYSLGSFKDKELAIPSGIIYYGRHLAYTKKEGRFYEWSIYIPDKNIVLQDRYRVLAKLNPETRQDPNRKYLDSTFLVGSLMIRPSEFNTFVLGAMKECSDNPEAIENITYDRVSELSNKIRNSIEK